LQVINLGAEKPLAHNYKKNKIINTNLIFPFGSGTSRFIGRKYPKGEGFLYIYSSIKKTSALYVLICKAGA